MPTLLADAAAELDAWTLTPLAQLPTMQVAYTRFAGTTPSIQLHDRANLGIVTTPWPPNVYRGTGNEDRVTMTVSIPDNLREHMELVEERIRDLARPSFPKIDSIWHSSSKPGDRYKSTLKAKINIRGDKMAKFVDSDGNPVDPPTQWHNLAVIPVLTVRGVYFQKTSAGLMMEVSAVMVGDVQAKSEEGVRFI
jgi:hypothetical protein